MSEEIDIIELLKRVKEGKAPKRIEINSYRYELNDFNRYYREEIDGDIYNLVDECNIFDLLNSKIKILDKPIIEEIPTNPIEVPEDMIIEEFFANKINEIIRHINKERK